MSARLVTIALALAIVAACGDPPTPNLLVTDQCRYDGPGTIIEGEARLTLQRTGLGDYGAAVVRFPNGNELSDLEALLEEDTPIWENWPDWVQVRYLLEVNDDTVTSPQGNTVLMELQPDGYALVCINFSDENAAVAATVEVVPDDD